MRSVLRQFIREALVREAVGQDPFFKMTGDSNLKIPKAGIGLNNALVEAIANSPFLSSIWGSLKILVPSASTLAAATAVSIGAGIAAIQADDAVENSDLDQLREFLTVSDKNTKLKNQTDVENFNKALQGLLAPGSTINLEIAEKIKMTAPITTFAEFESSVKPHYNGKVDSLKKSSNYDDLLNNFSLEATKGTIDNIISTKAKDNSGNVDSLKKQAYQQWAYYNLVLAIARQIPASCVTDTTAIVDKDAKPPLTAAQQNSYKAFFSTLDNSLNTSPNVVDARKFNPSSP